MTRSLWSSKWVTVGVGTRVSWFLPFEDGHMLMNGQYLTALMLSKKAPVVIIGHGVHSIDACLF